MANETPNELIPALAYTRKSTKGEKADIDGKKRLRQEKSLSQQTAEIRKLAKGKFEIVEDGWFSDDGISGYKRGTDRPDFQKMLDRAEKLGAQAILVDNLDRFSRAAFDEVQEDATALRKAGVRFIVSASHGEYDLGSRFDIGCILKFVVSVWSACEFSRQLSRRVSLAKRNEAEDGNRCGGKAPFAMESCGEKNHHLRPGDPKLVKVVQRIFHMFANEHRSMNSISDTFNVEGIPGPRGGDWFAATIREILIRRCYMGDFQYNIHRRGQYFRVDATREVVEVNKKAPTKVYDKGVFVVPGKYEAIVTPELFEKAQQRIAELRQDRGQRKRGGYALSGILRCHHCGGPMYGCKGNRFTWVNKRDKNGKKLKEKEKVERVNLPTIYRCGNNSRRGKSTCKWVQVREDRILPFVIKMLREVKPDLLRELAAPPESLIHPQKCRADERKSAERERKALAAKIERAADHLLDSIDDKTIREMLDKRIKAMHKELAELDAKLATESEPEIGWNRDEITAIREWYDAFDEAAVSVAVTYDAPLAEGFFQDPFREDAAVRIDPLKTNSLLRTVGGEVTLRWKTVTCKTQAKWQKKNRGIPKADKTYRKHVIDKGRFKLGQLSGPIPKHVLQCTVSPFSAMRR